MTGKIIFFFYLEIVIVWKCKKNKHVYKFKTKKHIIPVKNIYNIYVSRIVGSRGTRRRYQITGFPIFILLNGLGIRVGRMW